MLRHDPGQQQNSLYDSRIFAAGMWYLIWLSSSCLIFSMQLYIKRKMKTSQLLERRRLSGSHRRRRQNQQLQVLQHELNRRITVCLNGTQKKHSKQ